MHITEGMTVDMADGEGGRVAAVVVEPVSWRVSHVVVENGEAFPGPRLVPAEWIVSCSERMQLSLRHEELERCDRVQQIDALVPGSARPGSGWEVGIIRGRAWPGYDPVSVLDAGRGGTTMIYDRIPEGHVELRRKTIVVGHDYRLVGHVDGLVVDADLKLTELLLEKGRLWRHRGPSVPIGEIQLIKTDLVRLRPTRGAARQRDGGKQL